MEQVAAQRPNYDQLQAAMQSHMQQMAQPPQPLPSQNLAQQASDAASQPQRGGVLMRGMRSFLYGAGQSMMHDAGLPTDFDLRKQKMLEQQP